MNGAAQFQVQEIREIAALRDLEAEWNALWHRCAATTFQRPEWLVSWMEIFHPGEPWSLAVRHRGELVGMAPMYIQREGGKRNLAHIGLAVSDYLDWLIAPEIANPVLCCILEHMRESDAPWTRFDLSDLPCHSPLLALARRHDFQVDCKFHDACPVLRLPASVDELKKVVPHHQLRSLKSARKKIQRLGEVRVEVATRQTLGEFLEALFRLHESRWSASGEAGVFASEGVRGFHQRVAPALLDQGVLRLYALRVNGQIIASLYALFEGDTASCYLQGFDPGFAEVSPGAQILAAVIEDAVRERKRSVDFLRGREAYKYAWGARDVPTFRLCGHKTVLVAQVSPGTIAA